MNPLSAALLAAAVLPQDIGAAKQDAVDFLVSEQLPDGTWILPSLERYTHAGAAFLGFALIQAGLPQDHLAIQRIQNLLRPNPPRSTYDASVRVLFYDAAGPDSSETELATLAEFLIPDRREYFGYRMLGSTETGDLSNHQFALLALEVLDRHGLGPTEEGWVRLAEFLIDQQAQHGGWDYFAGHYSRHPSMTLAGAACVAACRSALLRHGASTRIIETLDESLARADTAIQSSWYLDASRKQAPLNRWIHYANATIERLGALTGRRILGGHDWYQEIAEFLSLSQRPTGAWSSSKGEPVLNTGLALATLSRATANTGGTTAPSWAPRWEAASGPLKVIAQGTSPCTAFVTLPADQGVVMQCEWNLNGSPLGSGAGRRGAIRFPLTSNGTHTLRVKASTADDILEAELEIHVDGIFDEAEAAALKRRGTAIPLYERTWDRCEASSAVGAGASWAIDGSLGTSWRYRAQDQAPTWRCQFEDRVKHRGLLIEWHLPIELGLREVDPHSWLEVRLDRKKVRDLEWDTATQGLLCDASRTASTTDIEIRIHPEALPSHLRPTGIAEVRFIAK